MPINNIGIYKDSKKLEHFFDVINAEINNFILEEQNKDDGAYNETEEYKQA